ncbi:MAG: hypothetical protein KGJ12_04195 [Gammaproteobacteria bacterium]|nr:hypothetical protein [Gammaproteobacteria bacterium]
MVEKQYEDDDPMVLVGVGVPGGDAGEAAEAFISEFMGLGLDDRALLELFKNPFYLGTHRIYREKGEQYVTALIARLRDEWSLRPRTGGASDEVDNG